MLHFHPLQIVELKRETDDCVAISFAVPPELRDAYRFTQGQHVALRTTLGGEELRRTYSLCTRANDEQLRIAIKRHPHGRFSTWANEQLRVGDRVEVMTPAGSFHTPLDPQGARLYVALTGGSGITPVISNVKTILATEPRSRFILFYANRTTASIIFREELEDLKNRYFTRFAVHHFLTREQRDVELYNGRIDGAKTAELCRGLIPVAAVDAFFLCGPDSMNDDVSHALQAAGAPASRIHAEWFTSAAPAPAASAQAAAQPAAAHCNVTVVLDGVSSEYDMAMGTGGESILDAALARGLDLPYSCKAGVCTTCRAKLMEGKVDFTVNYGLEPYEIEDGIILTCQSRPLTERVLIDFDEAG
jgi:ring-1,2-phenylacetyl-CoA epoxidase subunit PaaE